MPINDSFGYIAECVGIRLYYRKPMVRTAFSGFEWDAGNRNKCVKHGVSREEIEYVLAHAEALLAQDADPKGELRLVAIGRTAMRRYTFVVFTPRPHHNGLLLRPISARYMHQREVRKYEQEIARAQKR